MRHPHPSAQHSRPWLHRPRGDDRRATVIMGIAGCGLLALVAAAPPVSPAATAPSPAASPTTDPAASPTTAPTAFPQADPAASPTTDPAAALATNPATSPATQPALAASASPATGPAIAAPGGGAASDRGDRDERRSSRSDRSSDARGDDAHPPAPAIARSRRLDDSYRILLERSIFAKGGSPERSTSRGGGERGDDGGGGERPSAPPPTASRAATLVFTGSLLVDGRWTAFVEDPASKSYYQASPGELLAGHRVRDVTLNTLEYEDGARVRSVQIGQALQGGGAGPTAAGSSTGPTQTAASTAAPAPGAAANLDGLSVEERMKRKRQSGQ